MKIKNCDRDGCYNLRGQYLRYERILREYRCQCGRALSQVPVSSDYVVIRYRIICQDCGETDTITHYNVAFFEAVDAAEVVDNLPEEYRALIKEASPIDIDLLTEILF